VRLEKRNDNGYKSLQLVAEEYGELIEWAERTVPGIKYDESKLIESIEMEKATAPVLRDLYELRKLVPCPVSSQDAARLGLRPGSDCNPKGMEFLKIYQQEMHERADKCIGGVKEEKLRIAWTSTFNYGRGTMELLARKGVSLVWFNNGTGPMRYCAGGRDIYQADIDYGRKLSPLEELAAQHNYNTWGHGANEWIDPLIKICKELKIDAVVDFQQVGCIVTRGFNKITADRITKELGIPVLALDGRERFMTKGEETMMYQKLEDFLDMCIAKKKTL
jgi:benzoyl-CoA reductase/2-hydroxyglutaryl-CoA dehydratase subunit BcrC/BadD/HgdB